MGDTIVFVYFARAAVGDELMWAVKSAAKFVPHKNIVVCGDHPGDWFTGDFIPCPRISVKQYRQRFNATLSSRWQKLIDSINKLDAVIKSDLVTERFLWMYDDSFIVRDTTIDELSVPRYYTIAKPTNKKTSRDWHEGKRRTFWHLHSSGYRTFDFSTHYPVVFEKAKLQQTIEQFACWENPRCIESLYLNHWEADRAVKMTGQLSYSTNSKVRIDANTIVLNVGDSGWLRSRTMIQNIVDGLVVQDETIMAQAALTCPHRGKSNIRVSFEGKTVAAFPCNHPENKGRTTTIRPSGLPNIRLACTQCDFLLNALTTNDGAVGDNGVVDNKIQAAKTVYSLQQIKQCVHRDTNQLGVADSCGCRKKKCSSPIFHCGLHEDNCTISQCRNDAVDRACVDCPDCCLPGGT